MTNLNKRKQNQSEQIRVIMARKSVKSIDLAKALKVTNQTVYNIRSGNASDQLLEHALMVLDNWES